MAISNLTSVVMATSELSDQNGDNLAVVSTVMKQTAELLNQTAVNISLKAVTGVSLYIIIIIQLRINFMLLSGLYSHLPLIFCLDCS